MTEAAIGRRERKNQQTRAAITRAALELTLERGYERATIAEIAERADVSARTVHTWFRSKDEILLGELDEPLARLENQMSHGGGDIVDRLQSWLHAEGQTMGPENELGHLRLRALATDPYLRILHRERLTGPETVVADAIAAETGAPPYGLAARAFAAALINVVIELGATFSQRDPAEQAELLTEAFTLLRAAQEALRTHAAT